jgi:hypothetical protein
VSSTNAEPVDWFRLESCSQNISSTFPSHPAIGLSGGLTIDPQDSASGGSGVDSPSSDDGISNLKFQRHQILRKEATWPFVTKSLSMTRAFPISRYFLQG